MELPWGTRVIAQRICDTVPAEGVSNVELAASLVAQIWRVDDATPRRVDASPPSFPTVPSFKSPRSSSLELLEHAERTRDGWPPRRGLTSGGSAADIPT